MVTRVLPSIAVLTASGKRTDISLPFMDSLPSFLARRISWLGNLMFNGIFTVLETKYAN